MRWIKKNYKEGNMRERSGFLFFPKKMSNEKGEDETRWLEHADWIEKFLGYGETNPNYEYWVDIQWTNE
jgi:hypothetical protein